MSGARQVYFTDDMDRAMLDLRGKIPMWDVAERVGVSLPLIYRRLRELRQPIQPRRPRKRKAS